LFTTEGKKKRQDKRERRKVRAENNPQNKFLVTALIIIKVITHNLSNSGIANKQVMMANISENKA